MVDEDVLRRVAEVRELSRQFRDGAAGGPFVFLDLCNQLLAVTVAGEGQVLRVTRGPREDTYVISGQDGPTDPLQLTNNHWLRVTMTLFLDRESGRWKTVESGYQYQLDREGDRWAFRYDYAREPENKYPGGHLQIRGQLTDRGAFLDLDTPLERVHFPTGRIALEAVIRILAEEFDVPTRFGPQTWRPVLAASEESFREIAHQPTPGPDRLLDGEVDERP